jgi:hypothetical protein
MTRPVNIADALRAVTLFCQVAAEAQRPAAQRGHANRGRRAALP